MQCGDAFVIALAFLWAWFQEKIMMDDREISVWHQGVFGRYRPRKNNFPECAWSNRRRRKRHIGDILVVHEERGIVSGEDQDRVSVRGIDKPYGKYCSGCGQKLDWSDEQ